MNTKRFLLAVVVVFIVHQALGYLIHQVLLMGLYAFTSRPRICGARQLRSNMGS